jgi:hydrogenase expression/formation protein HypC
MKVVKIDGDEAIVDAGGLKRTANLSFLKSARMGDYVLVHAGFAIEKIKEKEARETLEILRKL